MPAAAIDLKGRIVLPCFVDCHTHIDKGHIWPRKPNPDGSFMGALNAAGADRAARWNADDVARRMDFSLRSAYAHGTKALRTHLDSVPPQETISWPVFEDDARKLALARSNCRPPACSASRACATRTGSPALAKRVAAAGGVLGAVAYMLPDLEELLDSVFAAAIEHGLDLDFHADETDDVSGHRAEEDRRGGDLRTASREKSSSAIAARWRASRTATCSTRWTRWRAPGSRSCRCRCATCTCRIAASDGTTPRWRGVTLLHEMKARGIPVAVASDNTRDPFYAYGDLDMLEVYRMATRILHFDHPVGDWPKAVAATPAEIMRLDGAGIAHGRQPRRFHHLQGPELDGIAVAPGIGSHRGPRRQGDRPGHCRTMPNSTI